MLNKVEARTDSGSMLSLPFTVPSGGLLVEDITGLDPADATVVSTDFALMDGEDYQSSRTAKRNIVMTVGMQPDWTTKETSDLRETLYDWFMPKASVSLRFYRTGKDAVDIPGRVETFDAPLFASDPVATISILNFDPSFTNAIPTIFNGSSVSDSSTLPCTYIGNVDVGFLFTLNVNAIIPGFTLYNTRPDGTAQQLTFTAALLPGDVINISTISGNKYAQLTRGGLTTSLLYAVSATSNWITLTKGVNQIRCLTQVGASIPYTIIYNYKLGGL